MIEPTSMGMRRLLARPKAQSKLTEHKNNMKNCPPIMMGDYDDDDVGSIAGSDDEKTFVKTEDKEPEKDTEKVVRKVVKKVVKKVAV